MFVDRVTVQFSAGKGGNGVVAWRREKYIPKGGPAGGNGGKGGSIILEASSQLSSLDWFRHRRLIKADNGGDGGGNCRQGKNGKDLVLPVPRGTLVKDATQGSILHDFTQDGEQWILSKGEEGVEEMIVLRLQPTGHPINIQKGHLEKSNKLNLNSN